MLPIVHSLMSFDLYRDGGSMSASFKDVSGVQHELLFPVDLSARWVDGNEQLKYNSPILNVFRPNDYFSPVTGQTYSQSAVESYAISWEQARQILDLMEPLVCSAQADPDIFMAMVTLASSGHRFGA